MQESTVPAVSRSRTERKQSPHRASSIHGLGSVVAWKASNISHLRQLRAVSTRSAPVEKERLSEVACQLVLTFRRQPVCQTCALL